jgi:hypothetical protein
LDVNTIKVRKSVRTFSDRPIPSEVMARLEDFARHDTNPFGVPITFKFLDRKRDGVSSPVIVGANTYVAAKYRRQEDAELGFGYSFEKFVLLATSLGLGTVWLAATIDRKAFERALGVGADEVMPAVSPIGYAAEKRSVRESLMRRNMKSDDRAPFESLFFRGDFDHPLGEAEAGGLLGPLQMVRWSPSATNKQPWRLVVDGSKVHFYEHRTRGYARESTGDIQKVDMGIAACHFQIAAEEAGLPGRFLKEDPGLRASKDTDYVTTYAASAGTPLL